MSHQLPLAGVVEAVIDGVQQGSRDFNLPAKLIGIMSRTFGQARCQQELDALLTHRDQIVALDLAGDELGFPGNCLLIISNKLAMQAGTSASMQVKPQVQTVFGMQFNLWGHPYRAWRESCGR